MSLKAHLFIHKVSLQVAVSWVIHLAYLYQHPFPNTAKKHMCSQTLEHQELNKLLLGGG